jgi:hypothetical protein
LDASIQYFGSCKPRAVACLIESPLFTLHRCVQRYDELE